MSGVLVDDVNESVALADYVRVEDLPHDFAVEYTECLVNIVAIVTNVRTVYRIVVYILRL